MAADTPGPADRPHGGLYSHYCKITDANTKEAVGAKTMLAVMDCRDNASEKNNYLSSHTGVAACAVRFRLYLEDGTSFPPHVNQNELGYGLHLTFNHLMFAPKVRLECRFFRRDDPGRTPHQTVVLEFHFSSKDERQLQDFKISSSRCVSSTSNGATFSGLELLTRGKDSLPQKHQDIIEQLLLLRTSNQTQLRFEQLSPLSGQAAKIQQNVHAGLPGGSGQMLKSLSETEYAAFAADSFIKADKTLLKKPKDLMSAGFPMVPLSAQQTFGTVIEAAVYLTYSTATAHCEEDLSLKLWARAGHKAALFRIDHLEQPVLGVKFSKDFPRLGSEREDKSFKLPRELHVEARTSPWIDSDASDSDTAS